MAKNQLLPLEMVDSSILDSSLGSFRDDSETTTGAASMVTAPTSTTHGSQRDGAELMQILGIQTQTDAIPRRSSQRKRHRTAPSVLDNLYMNPDEPHILLHNEINENLNSLMNMFDETQRTNPSIHDFLNSSMPSQITRQNSTLQSVDSNEINQNESSILLQHEINENSSNLVAMFDARPRINQNIHDIINSSLLNHIIQQNSTLQSVDSNQSLRREIQQIGEIFPNIQSLTGNQISIDDLFPNGIKKKKNDSASVSQEIPTLSEAEIALKSALDDKEKLSYEVQTLTKLLTCKICLDRQVSQVLLPCGHFGCDDCVVKIKKCSICRADIINSKNVYFA